jgi:Holliday junction resolvase RusA-like endonuclease
MKIIIDLKLENWNQIIGYSRNNKYGANYHKRNEMKKLSKFLESMPKIKKYPIKLTCYWHIKNKISDLDNKSLKSTLDCMQQLGKLENDNCKHIQEIHYKYVDDKKDYLEIEIEEL